MTDEAIKKKILMNTIKLQERTIEQIVRYAAEQYNNCSYYAELLNARLDKIEGEAYFEADGRRSQARDMLSKIAEMADVKIEYVPRRCITHVEDDQVTYKWSEAYVVDTVDD